MRTRYGYEMISIGAKGKKKTVLLRPLLVGALAAGVAALGVSAAVAAGSHIGPSPVTSGRTMTSTAAPMMTGTTAPTMTATTAPTMTGTAAPMMTGTTSGTGMRVGGMGR